MGCGNSKNAVAPADTRAAVKPQTEIAAQKKSDTTPVAPPVKVVIREAWGLSGEGAPGGRKEMVASVRFASLSPDTAVETDVTIEGDNPRWYFTTMLPGYTTGDELFFMVLNKADGKNDVVATGTLAAPFVASGYIGRVELEGATLAKGAHLIVNVDGATPNLAQQIGHLVDEGHTAVAVAVRDGGDTVGEVISRMQTNFKDITLDAVELVTDCERLVGINVGDDRTGMEDKGVKVTVIQATGIDRQAGDNKLEASVLVSIPGKNMNAGATDRIMLKETEAQWLHEMHLEDYASGDAIDVTLMVYLKDGTPVMSGTAALNADTVKSGFVGELELQGPGAAAESKVKIIVDPTDASIKQQAIHIGYEVKEVATETAEGLALLKDVGERLGQDAQDIITDAQGTFSTVPSRLGTFVKKRNVGCCC